MFAYSARRIGLCALIAILGVVVVGIQPASPPAEGAGQGGGQPADRFAPYVPGELLVKFRTELGLNVRQRDEVRAQLDAEKVREFRSSTEHWRLPPGHSVESAIAELRNNPQIDYAEPNYIIYMDYAPNDAMYPDMWGLNNTGQTGGTPGADIDAERAWNVSTGSSDVMVAVIDTGVDYTHPDLAANIWTNPGEIAGNGIDDDSNGYIDDIHGWDFRNGDNDPFDDHGHGTHCSGTIGAIGDNGIGVAGVNWDVTIVGLKFLSSAGSGSTADAVSCIEYATDLGVDIMSNSWGGGGFSQTLLDAINAAGAAEIVFVAAAGNGSADTDVTPHYPSSYTSANIIAVMATDHNDERSYWTSCACWSNIGPTTVDLAAPGSSICSTFPGNSYNCSYGGTSMATPHVAGAAALLRAVAPGLPAVQVKQVLMDMADPIPALSGMSVTGARLNAFFPIADPDDTPPNAILDLAVSSATSNSLFLNWTATGDDGDTGTASTYDMRYSTSSIDDTNFDAAMQASGTPAPGPFGTPESMEVLDLDPGTTYYFAVKAQDEWGNSGPISNVAMGMTLAAPVMATSTDPDPLVFDLLTGQSDTGDLYIDNAGPASTLDWRIPLPTVSGPVVIMQEPLALEKGESDPRAGDPVVNGFGGPDVFGYRWIDSDEPGGPTFTWNDISLTGFPITGLDGDDETSLAIPLGFDFSFYGNTFDSVRVCTNGWVSFTSSATTYSNQTLPTTSGPENMIAPFWDDLDFNGVEKAAFYRDGNSFIVQWTNVEHFPSGSSYTFQVEIFASGAIHYRYHTMVDRLNECTVGIQNDARDDGLTVAFNTDYVHDGLEIRIAAIPQWMTAAPTSGRLWDTDPPETVTLSIDATGLDGGTYEGSVYVQSNDPVTPSVEHLVTLNVTGAPSIQVAPLSLDFGHVYVGYPESLQVQVNNTGTDTLTISSIVSGDPTVTVAPSSFTVPAHAGQTVDVTYTPIGSGGTLSSLLTITSDASNAATVDVTLAGTSSLPPDMLVDPTSMGTTLYTGGTEDHNLRVSNIGADNLDVTLSIDLGEAPGAAHVTVYDELVFEEDDVSAAEPDPRPGILGTGGPDLFGYTWTDSDEPGGPVFDWVDISGVGTWVQWDADNYTGSANVGPFPLGFDFSYYGNSFNEVRASVTGYLTFTSTRATSSNQPLPNSGTTVPENLLAVFWDGLYSRNGTGSEPVPSEAYYWSDGNRFIFQWTHFYRAGDYDADLNFQVILYRSGKIVYQYATMANTLLTSATIGMQNATKDDGLTVIHNSSYMHDNMAIQIQAVPEWLRLDATSAIIPPGGFQDFTVTFDAGDSGDAVFNGSIDLVSVDPPIATSVPATLTVIGVADAATDPTAVDFGTKFVGYPYTESLLVRNIGTGALTVNDVSSDDPELLVLEPVSGTGVYVIPPGESLEYNLRWLAPTPYTMAATVTVDSDDPDDPLLYVPVTGTAIMPPVFGYTPASFHSDLYVDESETHMLTISNSGGSDLEFQIGIELTDATVVVHDELWFDEEDVAAAEPDPRPGILGTGGPDLFGYEWTDSDEPGGPVFDWVDISGVGTWVQWDSDNYCGNCNVGPFPLGFDFPFYGDTFNEVRASVTGYLTFTSTRGTGSNQPLPNSGTSVPENLLAIFWDSLYSRNGTGSEPVPSEAYYYNDGSRFIFQYTTFYRSGDYDADLNFQVILYPSGKIVYQYATMANALLNSATIGLQNGAKDDGLTVVYNSNYVHDNMAIQIQAMPEWLTVSEMDGTVPPGGSQDIDVVLSAVDLIGGDYTGELSITTNDPFTPYADLPVTMHVTGYPGIAAAPSSLDFGTVFVGVTSDLDVTISNPGSDVLDVTAVAVTGEYSTDTSLFSLAVGETQTLTVTFAPVDDGVRPGSIVFTSNATGVPEYTVPLTGNGLWPPIAGVDPASIETTLPPYDGGRTKPLDLCNTGGSDLIWTAQASDVTVGAVSVHEELLLRKGDDDTGEDEEVDPRPSILGAGGPDAYGYEWTDSDEPGGPVYDWVDISGVGSLVWPIGTYELDDNEGPFPIGFSFPWYENSFDQLYVTTEGWISFTSTRETYTNQPLPNSGTTVPENLLAALWDDLVHRRGTGSEPEATAVYYYNDGSRFIVQWNSLYRIGNYANPVDFEIILYPNGKVVYQYQRTDLGTTQGSHTIGWQNQDKDDGWTIVHNDASYVHDNLAIEISAGPEWLTVDPLAGVTAAGECTTLSVGFDSAELDEGDYDGLVSILNNDPFNSLIEVPVQLHVLEVELDYIAIYPDTLNLSSVGRTIKAVLQLPAPYDPHDIVIDSVSIYDQVYALSHPIEFTDENSDGVEELAVKFNRAEFEGVVPEGDDIPVTITGEVLNTAWFTGTDIIRAIRPKVTHPNGGDYMLTGQQLDITWDAPTVGPTPTSYSVWLDRDGSDELEQVAVNVTDTQVSWPVSGPGTTVGRIMVQAHDNRGVMGSDISDGDFTIADQLYPPHPAYGLALEMSVDDLVMAWQRPGTDLLHGPVSYYRIMRSEGAQGPFTEIHTTALETFTDSTAQGQINFYMIVATNPAGDALP
jgi:subtilisin family serine protease